jgi:HD-like signal output (HDOD) protein
MLTGLLHDIGRFYILTRVEAFPDLFSDPASLDELLHDWHTGVGRAIVESWGFAPAVAEAVDEHECLEREHAGKADLTDVVLVANFLAHRGDPRRTGQPAMAGIPGCVKMNLDEPGSDAVIAESTEEIRSMAQALGG